MDSDNQPLIFEARHLVAIIKTQEDVGDIKTDIEKLAQKIDIMAQDSRICSIGHENRLAVLERTQNEESAIDNWWDKATSRGMVTVLFIITIVAFVWDKFFPASQ